MSPPGDSKDTQTAFNGADPTETIDSIVLLDGGFATQLSCHVQDPIDGDILWSARFLETHPEAVIEAHLDFLRGGLNLDKQRLKKRFGYHHISVLITILFS